MWQNIIFSFFLISPLFAAEMATIEQCDDGGACKNKTVIVDRPFKRVPAAPRGEGSMLLFNRDFEAEVERSKLVDIPNQRKQVRFSQIREGACFVRIDPNDKLEFGKIIELNKKDRYIRSVWELDDGMRTLHVESNFWSSWEFNRDIMAYSCDNSPRLWDSSYLKTCLRSNPRDGKHLCSPSLRR